MNFVLWPRRSQNIMLQVFQGKFLDHFEIPKFQKSLYKCLMNFSRNSYYNSKEKLYLKFLENLLMGPQRNPWKISCRDRFKISVEFLGLCKFWISSERKWNSSQHKLFFRKLHSIKKFQRKWSFHYMKSFKPKFRWVMYVNVILCN